MDSQEIPELVTNKCVSLHERDARMRLLLVLSRTLVVVASHIESMSVDQIYRIAQTSRYPQRPLEAVHKQYLRQDHFPNSQTMPKMKKTSKMI